MKEELEAALPALRQYLTDDEIAHVRSLRSSSEVEKYLTECMQKKFPQQQPEVRNVKTKLKTYKRMPM